jgi:hypothetical protein
MTKGIELDQREQRGLEIAKTLNQIKRIDVQTYRYLISQFSFGCRKKG